MKVLRYDIGTLRPARRLPNGMLRVDGVLTKSGVFEYLNPDGSIRREYRPDSEVFAPDSMSSFEMCPFTDGHPSEPITAQNAKRYAVGSLDSNIRKDGQSLAGTIAVFDAATIKKMDSGMHQLSCGYEVDLEEIPGHAPDGQRYDAVQRNIRGNHVALVAHARAGESARVRMDAAMQQPTKERLNMAEPTKKEQEKAMEAALVTASSEKIRADRAEADLAEAKKRADSAEGELESIRVELTTLKEQRKDERPEEKDAIIVGLNAELTGLKKARADEMAIAPTNLRNAVKARVALEAAASLVLKDVRIDDLEDRDIMVQVVSKLHGVALDDEKSIEYVRARFDAAVEGFRAGSTAIAELRRVAGENSAKPAPRDDATTARAAMVKRNQEAWKPAVAK